MSFNMISCVSVLSTNGNAISEADHVKKKQIMSRIATSFLESPEDN